MDIIMTIKNTIQQTVVMSNVDVSNVSLFRIQLRSLEIILYPLNKLDISNGVSVPLMFNITRFYCNIVQD